MSILNIANEIATQGPDLTKAVAGGGGGPRQIPAVGLAQARLIGYIETGAHEYKTTVAGAKVDKCSPHAVLEFELSGPKYPPIEVGEGENKKLIPHTIRQTLKNISQNEKAAYYKTFNKMNWDQKAKHFSQLLGKPFQIMIEHWTPDESKPEEKVAQIARDNGIRPPVYEDPLSGETKSIDPPAPRSELKLFLWTAPPEHIPSLWASIFIDGEYTVGEGDKEKTISRNYWQNKIKEAKNFEGSPIHEFLAAQGEQFLPPKQSAPAGLETATAGDAAPDSDDPLA